MGDLMVYDFENLKSQDFEVQTARIVVLGAGGGGNNTINALTNMKISGATTIGINTDVKHLNIVNADKKILIGKTLTRGLGAGGYPDIGKNAALESREALREVLSGVDLAFMTCGMGGGTGTGALPVAARIAKENGAIVIASVTMPFALEKARVGKAEEGLIALREVCDTVIVIENQKLLEVAKNLPLQKAFAVADGLIAMMIKGIVEMISEPSLVNLDYADVKAIMKGGGVASIGVGESDSPNRALEAVTSAMNHPLLEVDYEGATGALIQVIGGDDMRLDEINTIGERIKAHLDPKASVIWGARIVPEMKHRIQVITVVTGVKSPYIIGPRKDRGFDIKLIK